VSKIVVVPDHVRSPAPSPDSAGAAIRSNGEATPSTAGTLAARAWLRSRGLWSSTLQLWHVDIVLDTGDQFTRTAFDDRTDTRLRIEIYSEEWGFTFCHARRQTRIRVTHSPTIDGCDDFGLLRSTPLLGNIGTLLRTIEHAHKLRFRRHRAVVRTNLPVAEASIHRWVESL
jgi:hypothetical protein